MDTDALDVYAKATIWDDNPATGSPSVEHEFYSQNEAGTDFGFASRGAGIDWAALEGEDFQPGTTYYIRLLVVAIHTGGPVAPPPTVITNVVWY